MAIIGNKNNAMMDLTDISKADKPAKLGRVETAHTVSNVLNLIVYFVYKYVKKKSSFMTLKNRQQLLTIVLVVR